MELDQDQMSPREPIDKQISLLHIGKYFPPFSGGMENFLADLIGSQVNERMRVAAIVHEHRPESKGGISTWPVYEMIQRNEQKWAGNLATLFRVPSVGRFLYSPVSPVFPLWLRRAIRWERPSILHLHLPNTSAFWVLALRDARRIPWVVHWHSDVVSSKIDRRLKLAYPFYRFFERILLRRAKVIIATSRPYMKSSVTLAPWCHKCHVVPLGLDSARIPIVSKKARLEARARWGESRFRILAVGRLTYYKGHEYLIRAMKEVPGGRALIVGEGERRFFLESEISELKLDKRVNLTGNLRSEDLHALMESCDCLCLPSVEKTEAFGMVLLEAMAHGKPVVACDVEGSGIGWVVEDGVTGRLVPTADPIALSEAFISLAGNPEMLRRMGKEGRHRYHDMFRIDKVGRAIMNLYRDLLGNRQTV